MTDRRPKALIADDEPLLREALARLLAQTWPELEVVGCAPEGRTALERLARLLPDVVLLDLEMPEMDGLETLKALRRTHPPRSRQGFTVLFTGLSSYGRREKKSRRGSSAASAVPSRPFQPAASTS